MNTINGLLIENIWTLKMLSHRHGVSAFLLGVIIAKPSTLSWEPCCFDGSLDCKKKKDFIHSISSGECCTKMESRLCQNFYTCRHHHHHLVIIVVYVIMWPIHVTNLKSGKLL